MKEQLLADSIPSNDGAISLKKLYNVLVERVIISEVEESELRRFMFIFDSVIGRRVIS